MITFNLERSFYGINHSNKSYQIFLDESGGNIGKLKSFPKESCCLNFTIKEHNIPPVFILAGVAQIKNKELNAPNWKEKLRLQNGELKFRKIGKNFFNRLGSKELSAVLEWIKENEIFIHFALYDWMYFYNVDIIDSLLSSVDSIEILKEHISEDDDLVLELEKYKKDTEIDSEEIFLIYKFYLKDILNEFINSNLYWFLNEIYSNHYCKIDSGIRSHFLECLYEKIKSEKKNKKLEFFLSKIDRSQELIFIYDEMDSKMNKNKEIILLIENMSPPYQNYLECFPKSNLYFDSGMEKVFSEEQIANNKIFFEDSKSNYIIQASDIIAGLLADISEQIQKYDENIFKDNVLMKLKPNHIHNLKLLSEIYFKSELESNGLFTHFFASVSFISRFQKFIKQFKM